LHNVDLTETTNVAEQYPDDDASQEERRRSWYSPTQNRTSYWSFNFTAAELSRLAVRQRLPAQRSTMYDYLFTVPTLREMAESLVAWNTNHNNDGNNNHSNSSNSNNHSNNHSNVLRGPERGPAGLYVELKDSDWIRLETGQDVVELLYQEIIMVGTTGRHNNNNNNDDDDDETKSPWPIILAQGHYDRHDDDHDDDHYSCHNAVVPGLIIQSFHAMDLQRFHGLWCSSTTTTTTNRTTATTAGDDTTTTSSSNSGAAMPIPPPYEPPYVLLVDYPTCTHNQFWFQVFEGQEEHYLSLVSAIGCELSCLDHSTVREHLLQYHLPAHAWTVRPEDVLAVGETFTTVVDQMDYLVCNTSGIVRGIFTETPALRPSSYYYNTWTDNDDCSPSSLSPPPPAVRSNNIPPTEWNNNNNNNSNSSNAALSSSFLGPMVASCLLGAAVTTAVALLWHFTVGGRNQRRQQQHRHQRQQQHDAVPTTEEEEIPPCLSRRSSSSGLEMT
jgi:hypothetical protein